MTVETAAGYVYSMLCISNSCHFSLLDITNTSVTMTAGLSAETGDDSTQITVCRLFWGLKTCATTKWTC